MIKTKEEIEKLKRAQELTAEGFEFICTKIRPGMTEIQIANMLDEYMFSIGASATAFDTIVGSGPNSAKIHSTPGYRKIKEKDIILLDFGYVVDGYCSDMSRTIFVGEVSDKQKEIYTLVYKANQNAIKNIKPGMKANEADLEGRKNILDAGFDYAHALGHGVGQEVHEEPVISPKRDTTLEENMVFTIEPGIYIENEFGVRIEDMVVLTKDGVEVFGKEAIKEFITII